MELRNDIDKRSIAREKYHGTNPRLRETSGFRTVLNQEYIELSWPPSGFETFLNSEAPFIAVTI